MIWEEMGKKRGGGRVIKGQKGLESTCYFNIQISKERYPLLPSLIPWKTDVPTCDACTQCEYSVSDTRT